MSHVQPYGVEVTESEIEELRKTGEVRFVYRTPEDEDDVAVLLIYDGEGDDDDGSGFQIDAPLP